MFLFVASFCVPVASADEEPCPSSLTSEKFFRCTLKGTFNLSLDPIPTSTDDYGSTAVYVHNNRESKLTVTVPPSTYDVGPGQGIDIILSNGVPIIHSLSLNCADCFLTIWHSKYAYGQASFVSDSAGAVFTTSGNGTTLAENYAVFFDFGDQTRLQVATLVHRREEPLTVLAYSNSTNSVAPLANINNSNALLTGPGYFHIASSPFLLTDFRIVVGSTVRLPPEFSNRPAHGRFAQVAVVSGNVTHVPGTDSALFVVPAVESTVWSSLAWAMLAVTIIVGLLSLGTLIFGIIRHFKGAKGAGELIPDVPPQEGE
jgi:hypothetical protein